MSLQPKIRGLFEKHPIPWLLSALLTAFLAGIGTYKSILEIADLKVVRRESDTRGSLRVETTPADAEIAFLSKDLKYSPGMKLDRGIYEIEASAPGFQAHRRKIQVGGYDVIAFVELERIVKLKLKEEKSYSGRKVSIDLEDAPVRTILKFLTEVQTVPNVIIRENIRDKMSLRLTVVPVDQAIDIVLMMHGLSMKKSGDVLIIGYQSEFE